MNYKVRARPPATLSRTYHSELFSTNLKSLFSPPFCVFLFPREELECSHNSLSPFLATEEYAGFRRVRVRSRLAFGPVVMSAISFPSRADTAKFRMEQAGTERMNVSKRSNCCRGRWFHWPVHHQQRGQEKLHKLVHVAANRRRLRDLGR